jgi:hypothetical protein
MVGVKLRYGDRFFKLMQCFSDSYLNVDNRLSMSAGKNISNLSDAVNFMLYSHTTKIRQSQSLDEGITNPKGWLHDCLKYGWHLMSQTANLPLLEPNEHYK